MPTVIPFTIPQTIGQVPYPTLRCRIAFGNTAATGGWFNFEDRLRSFSTSRGRDQDYGDFNAGTCTIVLDNRDRALDPTNSGSPYYPNIRPMNRVWLYWEFSGQTGDIFKGYVQSWNQKWPAAGGATDAVVEITASDEFLVLSLEQLPAPSPPVESYAAVVASDQADGYWGFNDNSSLTFQTTSVDFTQYVFDTSNKIQGEPWYKRARHRRHRHWPR